MVNTVQTNRRSTTGELFKSSHPFVRFTLLTYLFSWSVWTVMAIGILPESFNPILGRLGGFGPLVGALGVLWLSERSIRKWAKSNLKVRLRFRWYGYALLLPVLLIAAGGIVHALLFGGTLGLGSLPPFWAYPINLLIVFFIGGGQEEFGWRGFALPAAQGHLSALLSSLLVGVVWACWHLPLFLLPNTLQGNLPMIPYLIAVVGLSVILTWLYNSSGGSVLIPMVFHAGINPIGAYFPTGGVEVVMTTAGYGSYAIVVVAVALLLLKLYNRADLSKKSRIILN